MYRPKANARNDDKLKNGLTCTPNILSDGCLLTSDHSSFEPERKEVARPTGYERPVSNALHSIAKWALYALSPQVISTP